MELNKKIIIEIEKHIPKDVATATVLSKILNLGRESVYRRLRGDVSFSLNEVGLLSRHFKFSMDNFFENNAENVFFDIDLNEPYQEAEMYSKRLTAFIGLFNKMAIDSHSEARYALNTLPLIFYLDYLNLSEFKYFKWLQQSGKLSNNTNFNEIVIPPSILEMQRNFTQQSRRINSSVMILDRNVFSSMLCDVQYFYQLQLIDDQALKTIRQEMLDLVYYVEDIAEKGVYSTGKEISIYLSNIDMEASYSHFQYANNQYAHLRLYGMSGVDTQSLKSCEKQKIWIDSLKKHSTLISASGNVQRHEYFKKQKESILAIGTGI